MSCVTVAEVEARLRETYGCPQHHNHVDPVDELVFIVLSAQTEEYNYLRTYQALKTAHPNWEGVIAASEDEVANTIRAGGLFRKKARQLRLALSRIKADAGCVTLDFLREWGDDDVFRYLTSLTGLSGKSARCVMMYALGRNVLPVDTHVWRVARRLGWTRSVPKPSPADERQLEASIPPDLRNSLHVTLIAHGRATCRTYNPQCEGCALADLCPSRQRPDEVWSGWRKPSGVWASSRKANNPMRSKIAPDNPTVGGAEVKQV